MASKKEDTPASVEILSSDSAFKDLSLSLLTKLADQIQADEIQSKGELRAAFLRGLNSNNA